MRINDLKFSIGLDIDSRMIDYVKADINQSLTRDEVNRIEVYQKNFKEINTSLLKKSFPNIFQDNDKFNFVLADLGYNS